MPEQSADLLTYRALGPERVTHGPDAARRLPETLDRLGARRALMLTGPTVAEQTNLLWYIEQVLGPLHAASYTGVRPHTPSGTVAEAAELAKLAGADALVSLGGGSALDTAKAVAHALTADTEGPALPHVALPTTLSAAEFTYYAGVTDPESRVKRRVERPDLAPRAVLLDPRLTLVTPPGLWLSSGIKALDHALESLLNPRHHPITDTLALQAARELFDVLPLCAADPAAVEPRGRAQVAAWLSLFSPATARGGLSHALGHQLGAHGVPHGVTSCVTLSAVLRYLEPVTGERQAWLAVQLGLDGTLADAVAGLVRELGLPARLRETALPREALPAIAAAALPEAARVSTRPLAGVPELTALLESMW
jgi:alcohol dehydrogenase